MQSDQPVISLRPGGGGGGGLRGARLFPTAFAAATGSGDFLRPHGGASSGLAAKSGDSRFEPLERIRYSRDQLLELNEDTNYKMKRSKTLSSYFPTQETQSNRQSNSNQSPEAETLGTGASNTGQNIQLNPDDIVADPGLRKSIEEWIVPTLQILL